MDKKVLNDVDFYIKQKRYRLINSILVVKNNKIVFERYYNKFDKSSKHMIMSVWKSFLGTILGICLQQGYIKSLDTPVSEYLPEYFSGQNHPYHKLMTLRHLLTMTSGIYWQMGVHGHQPLTTQIKSASNWIKEISDINMKDLPGSVFSYKEADVMILSSIIGRVTKLTAYDLAKKHMFDLMEIDSMAWGLSPYGFSYNAVPGFEKNASLTARDMAKLGLLYFNKGQWDGIQIIPEWYIKEATTSQRIISDYSFDHYGYLWWLNNDGYSASGFGGQELNVVPDKNFISVIQATVTSSGKTYGDINETFLKKAIL